jgi:hypothetical protein
MNHLTRRKFISTIPGFIGLLSFNILPTLETLASENKDEFIGHHGEKYKIIEIYSNALIIDKESLSDYNNHEHIYRIILKNTEKTDKIEEILFKYTIKEKDSNLESFNTLIKGKITNNKYTVDEILMKGNILDENKENKNILHNYIKMNIEENINDNLFLFNEKYVEKRKNIDPMMILKEYK